MGEKRKLQTEIEKTLRRVEEGISGFDNVLDKAQDAVTSPQKDKLEAELKREMKKLQRYLVPSNYRLGVSVTVLCTCAVIETKLRRGCPQLTSKIKGRWRSRVKRLKK